ncbi:hypothetical protein BDP27DRAFT_395641 [Rhodocollybia butyracea]|uniref:Uncharacterized protein n=1 Tax=Rhodocollybia butyracea TaxID=206335 RepID=A0A9P5Q2S0_9AGAR|nr:hypothetical protein BDP27DRAFT_395641 [Rhodocollybia butyracea]
MNWPIVTTGDTTGEHVLAQLGSISTDPLRPQKPVTTLSIFKVPHHGSQRNSHVVNKISISDPKGEKSEYFFLALSAWYLGSEDFARRMNRPVDPVLAQFRDRVYLSRVWDWSAVSHVDTPSFGPAMDSAFQIFQSYLEVYSFRYPPLNLALDGTNWGDWITFTNLLLDRFHAIEQSIRDGSPRFPSGYVSQLTSPSKTKFSVNQVKQRAGFHAPYVYGVPWYLVDNSMNSLNYDPFTLLQLVSKIVQFYERFDARNYVISANRLKHNHPNPTVIAAIMAAAFSRNDNSIRRLFVTDPWALNIEEIIYYLGFCAPTVTRDRWRDRVRLFYLEEDYVAAVPIDTTTDVPGCTEFRIDAATDLTEVRFELHNQFSQVNAYNTPFSTWLTHSSFAVSILDPTSPTTPFGWLTIINNPLRFDLFTQSQNIPLVELGRTGPSPAQRGSTLNMSLYSMTLVGSPLLTMADIVFLQRGEWYQLVIGQEILCYTKDDTTGRIELNFQPLTPTPTGIARLQFKTQFQPRMEALRDNTLLTRPPVHRR